MQDNVLHTLAIDVKKMIQDADGVVFSKDGKTLLACSKPLEKWSSLMGLNEYMKKHSKDVLLPVWNCLIA